MTQIIDANEQIRTFGEFTVASDPDNADSPQIPADPTTVTLKIWKNGSNSVTTLTYGVDSGLIRDSTGSYHYDVAFDSAGTWLWEYRGSGSVKSVAKGSVTVLA